MRIEKLNCRWQIRVSEGGHNIEPEVIERRYIRGIKNLFDIYLPIVDGAFIFDNSDIKHELIADKQFDTSLNIVNKDKFNRIPLTNPVFPKSFQDRIFAG